MAKVTDAQLEAMSVEKLKTKITSTGYWYKLSDTQKEYAAWTLNSEIETTSVPDFNPFNPNETGVSSKWLLSPAGQKRVADLYNGISGDTVLMQQIQNSSAPTQALFAAMVTGNLAKGGDATAKEYQDTYLATTGWYATQPGAKSKLPSNFTFDTFWNTPTGQQVYQATASIPENARNLANGKLTPNDIKINIWTTKELDKASSQIEQRHKVEQLLNTIYQKPEFKQYYSANKFDGVYNPVTKKFNTNPTSGSLNIYHQADSGYSASSGAVGFQSAIGAQGAVGAQGAQGATRTTTTTTPPVLGPEVPSTTTTTTPPSTTTTTVPPEGDTPPAGGQKKLTDAEQWALSLTKQDIKRLFPAGYGTDFYYYGFDGKKRHIDLANHPKIKAYIDAISTGQGVSPYEARRVGYLANGSYHAPKLSPGVTWSIDRHLAVDSVVYNNGALVPGAQGNQGATTTTTTTPPSTTTTTTTVPGSQGAQGSSGDININLGGPQGSQGTNNAPITLYGNKPKEGSLGAALQSVFPGTPTGTLADYTRLMAKLTPQQKVTLAQVLAASGINVNFKNKLGVAQNNELIRALGVAFNSYYGAYKGVTGKLRPLAGYFDDVLASGANLSMPLTLAQQAQIAAQQAAAQAREARMQSSIDIISEHLANMGFTGDQLKQLAPFVSNQVHSGLSQTAVYANLRRTPQYAQRFPGNAERLKLGKAVLNEGTYTAYEDRIAEIARSYGLPTGALNAQVVGHLIANSVAPNEFENRVVAGYEAMQKADKSTLQMLQQYYNLNPGDIVHYIIDPKNGAAAIERKVSAAKLGASALDAGFKGVTSAQAEDFAKFQASKGVNVAQGIQQAGGMKQLMGTAPGQARQGLTQDQLLTGAIGTTSAAQQTLAGAQEAQLAPLKAGGGNIASAKGVTGAGYAATE